MAERIVSRNLAGLEDLLLGKGSTQQERAGQTYLITKIPFLYPCDSIAELYLLDTSKFQYAAVFDAGVVTFYRYDTDTWVSYVAAKAHVKVG